jgi:hypothetical protein
MDNRSDIWRHLQDHEIPPPAEVLGGLRMKLHLSAEDNSADFKRLQDHMVAPPDFLWPGIKVAVKASGKEAIKAAAWPAIKVAAGSAIKGAAGPAIKGATGRAGRSKVRVLLPYIAAACLLLILVGVVVDRVSFYGRRDAAATTRPAAKYAAKTGAAPIPDTAGNMIRSAASGPGNAIDSSALVASTLRALPLALGIDGRSFSLVDNNPLITLISYKYPSLKQLIDGMGDAGFRIQLDQYTNIVLSPSMAVMIKDLYDTRSNGQPSRKARKTKERLQKWKTDDENQFDGNHFSNPLDPIDLASFVFPPLFSFGRRGIQTLAPLPGAAVPSGHAANDDHLTVSYTLKVLTKRGNSGIGEAYNGGIETIFLQGSKERLRLASLMRIQSIFYGADGQRVALLTESGAKKNKRTMTFKQWSSEYNRKYRDAAYAFAGDTTQILGYACKKADISLNDGRHITAWYTPVVRNPAMVLEPAFAGIPGLVLRYEYTYRRKTICYTATSISHKAIDPSVFDVDARP